MKNKQCQRCQVLEALICHLMTNIREAANLGGMLHSKGFASSLANAMIDHAVIFESGVQSPFKNKKRRRKLEKIIAAMLKGTYTEPEGAAACESK